MRIVAKTDIGNQRSENQDNYRAGRQPDNTVWALVCDGMGGTRGGKLASTLAAEYMEERFVQTIDTLQTSSEVRSFLVRSLQETNTLIYNTAKKDPDVRGMGTTVVCAVIRGNLLQYIHAGDSRAYLYHRGNLTQLTKDHSMVQELLEQGSITQEQAAVHPNKNLITRAMGVAETIELDYEVTTIEQNDVLLLCTDGLSNCVTQQQMIEILQTTPFEQTADALVSLALQAGGQDNITVLLVQAHAVEENANG